MTLCVPLLGGDPSSPVLGPRKRPTPSLPPYEASDSVMVTLPPETCMFDAWMAPARVWQRRSTAAYTDMPEPEAAA